MNIIQIQNFTKYYGKSRGVIDLNLEVKDNDFFGFIGPNGAGKSTTIRYLLGLIKPTSGRATIFDKDCIKDSTSILEDIGYMPSEAMFYNDMRVQDLIKLSANLHRKDCTQEAKDLCDRFQLDTRKKICELSLGNRKKVSIICALQHSPRLYILDEPTSGLDPLMQKEFFDVLTKRNKEGATVFLSSHVLNEIKRYCNHAAIIREGKLIAHSTVYDLSKSDTKKISIYGITTLPALLGVSNVEFFSDHISFLFQGPIPELLQSLQNLPITDISITDLDLDEIFMHFYESK
jgi:ABC-2 type transport system ATP-binding protein